MTMYAAQLWPVMTGVFLSTSAAAVIRLTWRRGKSAAES